MIVVARTDPHHPQAAALLKQSHTLMQSLFPPEDNYYLDIDDLAVPNIHFYTARQGDSVLGTGALLVKPEYGEVKSMFVSEGARGKGVGAALLRQIEDTARDEGVSKLMLETGSVLHAAHRLYARHGFTECGVFGDYVTANSSVFMEKSL